MPRFRLRHVPLVLAAIARWVVRTRPGRWFGAVVLALVALAGTGLWLAVRSVGCDASSPPATVDAVIEGTKRGSWTGLHNNYNPDSGVFTISGGPGKSVGCSLRGKTGVVVGNGWTFKGYASVVETSCAGSVERSGRVSLELSLKTEWRGQVKGIGGDWDDESGSATCEGELEGTLAEGGTWRGTCSRPDRKPWQATLDWKLDEG